MFILQSIASLRAPVWLLIASFAASSGCGSPTELGPPPQSSNVPTAVPSQSPSTQPINQRGPIHKAEVAATTSGAPATTAIAVPAVRIPAATAIVTAETDSGRVVRKHFLPQVSNRHPQSRTVTGREAAGKFVTSLCEDRYGSLWVGTEGQGVVCRLPDGEWRQFTLATCGGQGAELGPFLPEGESGEYLFPENTCTSLAVDRQNRIWAGTLYHGVAVYNGERWRTYDVTEGPLGSRVFDLAVCPKTGDVWMATEHGLSRYSERPALDENSGGFRLGHWTYFTRAHGLASDQVRAMAIAEDGTLYAGTECDGLSIGTPSGSSLEWKCVRTRNGELEMKPAGTGLPSDQINDVLVAASGEVFVATNAGIAKSKDAGATWEYLRGRDFADKVENLSTAAPRGWKRPSAQKMDQLLPEDCVTCLAEAEGGQIWAGFRTQGVAVFGKSGSRHIRPGKGGDEEIRSDFVAAMLSDKAGDLWCAGTGTGLEKVPPKLLPLTMAKKPDHAVVESQLLPRHPAPAAVPTIEQITSLLTKITARDDTPGKAIYETDDWTTGGDWLGQYGRLHTVLWAMVAPFDQEFLEWNGTPLSEIQGRIGPHCRKGDGFRRWLHWTESKDHRVLFSPWLGHRRQADCDDHGEEYPMHYDGPDLWFRVKVPAGPHRLSMYFFNKDGESGHNRFRDYLISVFKYKSDPALAEKTPVLAQGRVVDFRGAVYKRFRVVGPATFFVKVSRNYSFNTICSGTFLDRLGPDATNVPYSMTDDLHHPPQRLVTGLRSGDISTPITEAITKLWQQCESDGSCSETAWSDRLRRVIAYRAARTASFSQHEQKIMRGKLALWSKADRQSMTDVFQRVANSVTRETLAKP